MGTFSIWHWIVVLIVVVLVFGTKKLRNFGGDLGAAIRGFKRGMQEDDGNKTIAEEPTAAQATPVHTQEADEQTTPKP